MKKNIKLLFFVFLLFAVSLFFDGAYSQVVENQIIEYLEFREVDIKDILRQLAKQYDLNIVFSESVQGFVTVQLGNVTVEQALDSIITVNGFAYNKKGSVYKVTTQDEASREGRQTKLFKLNNADAAVLKDTLSKVLTSTGSIEADTRSNSLLITDALAVINKLDVMIPSLDEMTPQVLIETKMIETSLNDTEKLGIDWSNTVTVAGSKRPTTFPFNRMGTDKMFYPIPTYTSSTDETTGELTVTSDFPIKGEAFLSPGAEHGFGSFPTAAATHFAFGTLDFTSLQAVFDLLKERKSTKVVANPRIVTLNNKTATINVGRVLSLPRYERNETTGSMEIAGWERMPVGVNLEVTPQISPNGHIKIKLKPEVSSLLGYASTRNGVNEGPITSTRVAETEVQIKDGETVVIGGLIKEEGFTNVKKVPILGDIPLIGLLFTRKEVGSTSSPTEKTDLLIFVTARIIREKESALAMAGNGEKMILPFKTQLRKIDKYRIE